jgi:MFS family permease
MFQIAFVWLILDLTGSKAATGLAATISYLPSLVFGMVAGLLVDRWNRRRVMAAADGTRAVLLALARAIGAGLACRLLISRSTFGLVPWSTKSSNEMLSHIEVWYFITLAAFSFNY